MREGPQEAPLHTPNFPAFPLHTLRTLPTRPRPAPSPDQVEHLDPGTMAKGREVFHHVHPVADPALELGLHRAQEGVQGGLELLHLRAKHGRATVQAASSAGLPHPQPQKTLQGHPSLHTHLTV